MSKRYLVAAALAALVVCAAIYVEPALAAAVPFAGSGDHGLMTVLADAAPGLVALEKQMNELAGELKKAADDVKKVGETTQTEIKNLGKATDETKDKADEALLKYGEMAEKHSDLVKQHSAAVARLVEVEQNLAQRRERETPAPKKTLGQLFVDSKAFKEFSGKGTVRVPMNRADITSFPATVGNETSNASSLVGTLRVPGIVTPPEQKLTIRDLIAGGETSQGMVEFVQETGYTNAAAVVTEGATKPTSDLTFELKHAPVRTIAHIFKASRNILDDAPALRSYIDARARYGLRLVEEDEILNGDGTGIHLTGLVTSATPFNAAFVVTAKQRMDTIRLAILQVFLANFPASGVVLHPTDWAAIQLTKDSQNRYIIGNPQDGNAPRLWNLPVVETLSMDETEFLVGAFNMGAQIFDRLEVEVLLSTENSTDFEKNMVTIRCEERLALATYRPESFVSGDFDTAT